MASEMIRDAMKAYVVLGGTVDRAKAAAAQAHDEMCDEMVMEDGDYESQGGDDWEQPEGADVGGFGDLDAEDPDFDDAEDEPDAVEVDEGNDGEQDDQEEAQVPAGNEEPPCPQVDSALAGANLLFILARNHIHVQHHLLLSCRGWLAWVMLMMAVLRLMVLWLLVIPCLTSQARSSSEQSLSPWVEAWGGS